MEVIILLIIIFFVAYIVKKAVLGGDSSNKVLSNDLVKEEYFKRFEKLGHSKEEIERSWKDFQKGRNDNRFLKNLGSVRAKYVR